MASVMSIGRVPVFPQVPNDQVPNGDPGNASLPQSQETLAPSVVRQARQTNNPTPLSPGPPRNVNNGHCSRTVEVHTGNDGISFIKISAGPGKAYEVSFAEDGHDYIAENRNNQSFLLNLQKSCLIIEEQVRRSVPGCTDITVPPKGDLQVTCPGLDGDSVQQLKPNKKMKAARKSIWRIWQKRSQTLSPSHTDVPIAAADANKSPDSPKGSSARLEISRSRKKKTSASSNQPKSVSVRQEQETRQIQLAACERQTGSTCGAHALVNAIRQINPDWDFNACLKYIGCTVASLHGYTDEQINAMDDNALYALLDNMKEEVIGQVLSNLGISGSIVLLPNADLLKKSLVDCGGVGEHAKALKKLADKNARVAIVNLGTAGEGSHWIAVNFNSNPIHIWDSLNPEMVGDHTRKSIAFIEKLIGNPDDLDKVIKFGKKIGDNVDDLRNALVYQTNEALKEEYKNLPDWARSRYSAKVEAYHMYSQVKEHMCHNDRQRLNEFLGEQECFIKHMYDNMPIREQAEFLSMADARFLQKIFPSNIDKTYKKEIIEQLVRHGISENLRNYPNDGLLRESLKGSILYEDEYKRDNPRDTIVVLLVGYPSKDWLHNLGGCEFFDKAYNHVKPTIDEIEKIESR